MAGTAKPYFGDIAEMTYEQLLRRYLELCGPRDSTAARPAGCLARRHVPRALRGVARPLAGPRAPGDLRADRADHRRPEDADSATAAVDQLVASYPEAISCTLHPADVHYFVEVCRRPGKPVNFVPVIDADVRRWWRSDSLWQAHDESYGADQVIAIPGPVSVGGITVKDEPVADLLDRFEAAIVETLSGIGVSPSAATSRSTVGADTTPLDAASASPDVVWAGRVVPNPLHRLEGIPFTLVPDGEDAVCARPLTAAKVTAAKAAQASTRVRINLFIPSLRSLSIAFRF